MLSCQEVTRTIASEEFAEAGWWPRLWIRLHLFGCRHCRRYAAQLQVIGQAARQLWNAQPQDKDTAAFTRLEEAILKGIPSGAARSQSAAPFKGVSASDTNDPDGE